MTVSDLFLQRALIPLIQDGYEAYWQGKGNATTEYPEIRISAHSVASSLAIKSVWEYASLHGSNDMTSWVKRVALLDPWFGPKRRLRRGARANESDDLLYHWARTVELRNGVFFEWYKTSKLCNFGSVVHYGHCNHPIQSISAMARLYPRVKVDSVQSLMNRVRQFYEVQHRVAFIEYFKSIAGPRACNSNSTLLCTCDLESFKRRKIRAAMKSFLLNTFNWDHQSDLPGFCQCRDSPAPRLAASLSTEIARNVWKGRRLYHISETITLEFAAIE